MDELQGDARAGELARRTALDELGVGDGDADGNEIAGLVVVGDDDVHTLRAQPLDLDGGGDAVVDRDDEVGRAVVDDAVEGVRGEAVALAETVRDVGHGDAAELAQAEGEQAGGAHAVNVEIPEDGDRLMSVDGPLDPVCRHSHAGYVEGVCPVAVERGTQECARLIGIADAACRKDACDKRRDAQLALEPYLDIGTLLEELPAMRCRAIHSDHLPALREESPWIAVNHREDQLVAMVDSAFSESITLR